MHSDSLVKHEEFATYLKATHTLVAAAADYLRTVTATEAFAGDPFLSTAIAPMVCGPCVIFFFCHVAEQEVTLAHVVRVLPSAVIVIDATPIAELAETAMLTLPFGVDPFVGELIVTPGGGESVAGAGVVTDTLDDWAEVWPAAS